MTSSESSRSASRRDRSKQHQTKQTKKNKKKNKTRKKKATKTIRFQLPTTEESPCDAPVLPKHGEVLSDTEEDCSEELLWCGLTSSATTSLPAPTSSSRFDELFARGRRLGRGTFASVFVGTHRATGAEYAVKQIDKASMIEWNDSHRHGGEPRNALRDEIDCFRLASGGPNIVSCHEIYDEAAFCYVLMEIVPGGELLEVIASRRTPFCEQEARSVARGVLRALAFLHQRRVVHRDVQPEHLLLRDPTNLNSVVLAGFSVARRVATVNGCRTLCGTPGYLCPEMLEEFPAYDTGCDVWSAGCLVYLLLGGCLPFDGPNEPAIFEATRRGSLQFPPEFWSGVSPSAKWLVSQLLAINPRERIAAASALKSHWIEHGDAAFEARHRKATSLHHFLRARRKLKDAVATVISAHRVHKLHTAFRDYCLETRNGNAREEEDNEPHHPFVEDSLTGRPFGDFYETGDELGEGGYATVYRCRHVETQNTYAVKVIDTSDFRPSQRAALDDEIASLRLLRGGAHILRLYDVFFDETPHRCCRMVLEEARGGDLLDRLQHKEVYTEREARKICQTLFEAVLYCHRLRIAHRDIKPENLLLMDEHDDTRIKLADFGFAKRIVGDQRLTTLCGTPEYVAPEVLSDHTTTGGYNELCDMWSVGVVTYVLLGGYCPFEGASRELARNIVEGNYSFHDRYWSGVSDEALRLIEHLLELDPAERWTAEEALGCRWMGVSSDELATIDLGGAQQQMEEQRRRTQREERRRVLSLAAMLGGVVPGANKLGFERATEDDFEDCYEWGLPIGSGTYSVVHHAKRLEDGKHYAVKRIPRVDLREEDAVALRSEIACLQKVADEECDSIVKLAEVFDEPDFTYVVLEWLQGGYLINKIIEKHFYNESKGLVVAKRLLRAVEHCHRCRIAIRDVRPDNLLLVNGSDTEVKLSDFGRAKVVFQPNSLTTVCGTEAFVAPEIIQHSPQYDVECDIWSLGVVLYILLGGHLPFGGEGETCLEKTRYGRYDFNPAYWSHVSSQTKHLISRMLTIDVSIRITAKEALESDLIRAIPNEKRRG